MASAIARRTRTSANGANVRREADVEGVEPLARAGLQVDVRLDARRRGGIEHVDPVDRGALQLHEALRRAIAPADDEPLVARRRAPVRVIAGEADLRAAIPALEPIGARAVRLGDDRLVGRAAPLDMRSEPGTVVDRKGRRRDLAQERDVRPAQLEHDGIRLRGADPLELAAVRPVPLVRGGLLGTRRIALGRVGDRGEGCAARDRGGRGAARRGQRRGARSDRRSAGGDEQRQHDPPGGAGRSRA